MQQFINGNDAAWAALEQQARHACVRFRQQPLPRGCEPAQADIGFEIEPTAQRATLYVRRGIGYSGPSGELREWFRTGAMTFESFDRLHQWIVTEIGGCLTPSPAAPLTDTAAVREGLRDQERGRFLLDEAALTARLETLVRGQPRALRALAGVIVRHAARIQPQRPAVLFAIGPTGVGKTRTAEILPKVLTDLSGGAIGYQYLRLDMAEFQEAHRVSQLLGAPQGYVGHNDGSQLLDALRANGRTIVLFDEIEKAHPAVLRALMNAMDAGRLSGAARNGGQHEVDCRQAVFIFTSNLDATQLLDELAARQAEDSNLEDEICRRRLVAAGIAPEIVGRIGRFLIYRSLSSDDRVDIMALSIADVAREYGLTVERIEPTVVVELMARLRSASFGARPAAYLIDAALGAEFARAAAEHGRSRVAVAGPPFSCEQVDSSPPVDTPSRVSATLGSNTIESPSCRR